MRANMRAGQRAKEGIGGGVGQLCRGFTSAPAQPFVFISLRFGLFFCCCRSHLWNGIETVFCFGFRSLSPPHSLSLSFYFSFCCFCCFPFQLLRLLFLSLRLCQSNWRSGSGSMLLSIKLVVGQDVTHPSPHSSLPPFPVTPFCHRSHFRPALYVPCPLAILLPKASLSPLYSPTPIPLIYSSRVKLSSEQTFISVHFIIIKKEKE